jgi:hypothetical protein
MFESRNAWRISLPGIRYPQSRATRVGSATIRGFRPPREDPCPSHRLIGRTIFGTMTFDMRQRPNPPMAE